jgi:hypothetical protein
MSDRIDRYQVRLADACEALHMAHTGASDPLPPEQRSNLVGFLRMRLGTWSPSPPLSVVYDSLWRALVEATLQEHERGIESGRLT